MKWNFFYDEGEDKLYQSLKDWYKDIKHLIWPAVIMVVLGIAIYIYIKYFHL